MRRSLLAIAAAAAIFSAGSLMPNRAEAMSLPVPAGVATAINEASLSEEVAYVCRRVWHCGYYGCGWRRACSWRPGGYYYRPHRYRHWRRW